MSTKPDVRQQASDERELLYKLIDQGPRRSSELRILSNLSRGRIKNHTAFLRDRDRIEKLCEVVSNVSGAVRKETLWGIPGTRITESMMPDPRFENLPKLTIWQSVKPWSH